MSYHISVYTHTQQQLIIDWQDLLCIHVNVHGARDPDQTVNRKLLQANLQDDLDHVVLRLFCPWVFRVGLDFLPFGR